LNPFDIKSALLAKHAQHVVLIHFPIALFIAGVAFDFLAQSAKRRALRAVAYYNFLGAAISAVPVVATGLLAWQFQLEGQKLKGILLMHLVLGMTSALLIWIVWAMQRQARKYPTLGPPILRLALETVAVLVIGITGHLGGFLSGINGPN
jgi:uncharacterized membrane protein